MKYLSNNNNNNNNNNKKEVVITKRHPLELQREMAVTILNRGFFDPSDTFSL